MFYTYFNILLISMLNIYKLYRIAIIAPYSVIIITTTVISFRRFNSLYSALFNTCLLLNSSILNLYIFILPPFHILSTIF
nr:MAG TPA: hypothetical protein [Caudoviricetes sp.]